MGKVTAHATGKGSARDLQRRLGERISMLRAAKGFTQEQLATACGITQKYLSDLERGEKAPSWETLVALANKGFDTNLATLMYGVDEDVSTEAQELSEILAGRSSAVKRDVLRALRILLDAGRSAK